MTRVSRRVDQLLAYPVKARKVNLPIRMDE
jgi:hypothetical protein